MIKLSNINKNISFNAEEHVYRNKEGQKLTSVTTLLGLFKEDFDPNGFIAKACAKRDGITVQDIYDKWNTEKDRACAYGTSVHSAIEEYIKTKQINEISSHVEIVKDFALIDFDGEIFSEIGLSSKKYLLAGTCDIAILKGKNVSIYDIKTNKQFTKRSKYGKNLLYPLNRIPDSHLHTYSLQILIYGEMVKEHGYSFTPGQILWINPETQKIERYDVLDLSNEVKKLLDHYRMIQDW